jgi:hypothetical protein
MGLSPTSRGLLRLNSESVIQEDNNYLPKGCVFSFLARMDRRGKMGDKLRKKTLRSLPAP